MDLRALDANAMIGLSTAWLDPKQHRKTIDGFESGPLGLKRLATAHAALLAVQVKEDATATEELATLRAEAAELDGKHDRKLRGTFNVLQGLSELADSPAEAASFLALQSFLFPGNLRMTGAAYTAEAGAVVLAEKRLASSVAETKLLESIPLPGKKRLVEEVTAWIHFGKKLGTVDAKRAETEQRAKSGSEVVTRAHVARVRGGWIKAVNALVANLALDDGFDDATSNRIFAKLNEAVASATRRGANTPADPTAPPVATLGAP